MRKFLPVIIMMIAVKGTSQELYPFTEPASNMPAKSISLKLSSMLGKGPHSERIMQRYMPEIMLGLNKNWMLHGSITFSDMHESYVYFESAKLYAKYRFYSNDEVHKHFRMAAFGSAIYSRNQLNYNEINMYGDQTAAQVGVIATQLWNKLAISGTVSLIEVFDKKRTDKILPQQYAFESLNYSLSAGYLVLPVDYKDYDQTNLNVYVELLGGRNLDWRYEKYFLDLAPSVQLIFKSTSKLNLGYRFQLTSDIYRNMKSSMMISYEYIFLNALGRKK